MHAVPIPGTTLEYVERGQGDPLILVHGTLGDHRSWSLQMEAFAERYRVISYSRRYHFPNPCRGDETDYSASLHADDLAAFMEGLGIHSAHVVGSSYGAYTTLFLAARHPERVLAMVLGDPPVFPIAQHLPAGRAARDEFLANVWKPAGDLVKRGETRAGIKVFVDGVVEEGAFDQFSPEVQDLILENACEFEVETSSPDFWTPFSCDDAERVTAATLLLTGDKSHAMFEPILAELARCLPNEEVAEVPETTHEVMSDNPEAYNQIVLDFLAKHPA